MENFFITVAVISLLACGNGTSSATQPEQTDTNTIAGKAVTDTVPKDTATLQGQWYLQPVLPSDTATGKIPTIFFDISKHKFNGNTGCNRMSGSFEVTDSSFAFNKDIITTRMACPGYNEDDFVKNLLRTNRHKFDNGVLVLMFDQTELSRWTRKPMRAPTTGKT